MAEQERKQVLEQTLFLRLCTLYAHMKTKETKEDFKLCQDLAQRLVQDLDKP